MSSSSSSSVVDLTGERKAMWNHYAESFLENPSLVPPRPLYVISGPRRIGKSYVGRKLASGYHRIHTIGDGQSIPRYKWEEIDVVVLEVPEKIQEHLSELRQIIECGYKATLYIIHLQMS